MRRPTTDVPTTPSAASTDVLRDAPGRPDGRAPRPDSDAGTAPARSQTDRSEAARGSAVTAAGGASGGGTGTGRVPGADVRRPRLAFDPCLPRARSWRGDVQGLRALAVLVVIADHFGAAWMPGGYVGVDVFFVISGFLISQHLYREVARSGRVSISTFYARRARRILPAATVVITVTVVASVLLINTVNALSLVRDAVWATFFGANFRFSALGTDYFTQTLPKSPLQHYWSLSVEEQFYLLWPVLLLSCVVLTGWWTRRRTRAGVGPGDGTDDAGRPAPRRLPRLSLAVVLSLVIVASLTYSTQASASDPTSAYFSTPARVWELALGALIALVAPSVAHRLSATARGTLSLAGVSAIVIACVQFGPTTQAHTWLYLVPDGGAAIALLAGAAGVPPGREAAPIRWLGAAPLRVVGDWSYSLYLWHWPVLIIAQQHFGRLDAVDKMGLVALTFLLADLSYRFVETPLRRPKRLPRRRALALYPVSAAFVCLVCVLGSLYGHYRIGDFTQSSAISLQSYGVTDPTSYARTHDFSTDPYVALVQASVTAAHDGFAVPSPLHPGLAGLHADEPDLGACDYTVPDLRTICPRGDTHASRSIVVLGNSHGRMWLPAVERIAERDHYKTYYFVKSNCTAADLSVSDIYSQTPLAPWTDCTDWRNWAFRQIAKIHPALSIVSTSGPNPVIFLPDGTQVRKQSPDRQAVTTAGFAKTFSLLQADSDRVALIHDVPKNAGDPGECLTSNGGSLGRCMFRPVDDEDHDAEDSVQAAEQLGVQHIDPTPWLCWRQQCPVVVGDLLTYRDQGHITTSYAAYLAPALGARLGLWD